MDSVPSPNDIARIEEHIEALRHSIETCRKIALAAKVLIALGALWLVLTLLGQVDFVPLMLIFALAAVIGGVVLAGSNATTWSDTEASLQASEAMRAGIIERMQMRLVGDDRTTIH